METESGPPTTTMCYIVALEDIQNFLEGRGRFTGKKIKFPDEVQLKQICSFIDESCKWLAYV